MEGKSFPRSYRRADGGNSVSIPKNATAVELLLFDSATRQRRHESTRSGKNRNVFLLQCLYRLQRTMYGYRRRGLDPGRGVRFIQQGSSDPYGRAL